MELLKRRILEKGLIKSWTVRNIGNTLAITMIFSRKCLKFDQDSINGTKSPENVFSF